MSDSKKLSMDQAKEEVLSAISKGATVEAAMASVQRTVKTWEGWRYNDKEFARRVDEVRAARKSAKERGTDQDLAGLSFAEWRKEFMGRDTYPHQQQWIDVLEGRDPIPIDGCEWIKRDPKRVVINVPPFHAKTETITADWITYKICMNPNIRVAIISKRREQAIKNLYQIRQRLTSSRFAKLQAAYAPPEGWKPANGDGSFSQTVMYVAGRTADIKDPTVEALGLGGQIYGSRYDIIIMDDCIVLSNANEFEKQITWIESEVESRVKNGHIVMVGTRLASQDLYSEIQIGERYMSEESPWSYLRQPMVLEYAEDPKDWRTLWPRTSTPMDEADEPLEDGMYAAWDGPAAAKVRGRKPPSVWALVYQQQQVDSESTFQPAAVHGSIDRRRKPGPLKSGAWGHPREGKEGMYTIASMDPAMAGDTFTVVGSVRRADNRWFIENAWVKTKPTPQYIRETIKQVTEEYRVNEWIIESNAFQLFLTQDPEIVTYLAARGVKLSPHYTSKNKADPDFGVASVATMFGTTRRINEGSGRVVHNGDNLISLPDPDLSAGIKTLIEQLPAWKPGYRGKDLKQDGPMALWFFSIAARRILGIGREARQQTHRSTRFTSRARQARRAVIPAASYDYRTE